MDSCPERSSVSPVNYTNVSLQRLVILSERTQTRPKTQATFSVWWQQAYNNNTIPYWWQQNLKSIIFSAWMSTLSLARSPTCAIPLWWLKTAIAVGNATFFFLFKLLYPNSHYRAVGFFQPEKLPWLCSGLCSGVFRKVNARAVEPCVCTEICWSQQPLSLFYNHMHIIKVGQRTLHQGCHWKSDKDKMWNILMRLSQSFCHLQSSTKDHLTLCSGKIKRTSARTHSWELEPSPSLVWAEEDFCMNGQNMFKSKVLKGIPPIWYIRLGLVIMRSSVQQKVLYKSFCGCRRCTQSGYRPLWHKKGYFLFAKFDRFECSPRSWMHCIYYKSV